MIGRTNYLCPVCHRPGQSCGDDHMTGRPISSETIKGDVVAEKLGLKEYEYRVGHLPVTALLTEKQAERLKAVAVGESQDPGVGDVDNNEAQRTSTHTREADDNGIEGPDTEDAKTKARTARNKRAS